MNGKELYELFQEANATYGETQASWSHLEGWRRQVWIDMAAKLKEAS